MSLIHNETQMLICDNLVTQFSLHCNKIPSPLQSNDENCDAFNAVDHHLNLHVPGRRQMSCITADLSSFNPVVIQTAATGCTVSCHVGNVSFVEMRRILLTAELTCR